MHYGSLADKRSRSRSDFRETVRNCGKVSPAMWACASVVSRRAACMHAHTRDKTFIGAALGIILASLLIEVGSSGSLNPLPFDWHYSKRSSVLAGTIAPQAYRLSTSVRGMPRIRARRPLGSVLFFFFFICDYAIAVNENPTQSYARRNAIRAPPGGLINANANRSVLHARRSSARRRRREISIRRRVYF